MLKMVSNKNFLRSVIKILEGYMNIAYRQSVEHGLPQARQFVVLFDMEGLNVNEYLLRGQRKLNTIVDFIVIFMISPIVMHNYLYAFYYNTCISCPFIILYSTAQDIIITLIKDYVANYPRILKHCYIINGIMPFPLPIIALSLSQPDFTFFFFIIQSA